MRGEKERRRGVVALFFALFLGCTLRWVRALVGIKWRQFTGPEFFRKLSGQFIYKIL
jgi:hypothetical protein